ncbi:Transcriptional regulator, AbiEi antitoxin, Type IV TA system [Tsukamurella ocularis]
MDGVGAPAGVHMADDKPVEFRHREELVALGATDRQIRFWQQKNTMTRVWRGAYHLGARLAPWDELRISALAAAQRSGDSVVLSHAAAAAVLGMKVLNSDWQTVDFTSDGVRGGTKRGRRRLHVRRLDAEDVVVVDGVTVTSIARTALDLALAGDFVAAVCALDAALRMGVTREELEAAIARLGRRRGTANMLAALGEASPLSESVGESRSRALMLKWPEIPRPELQREFFNEAGALEARVDFLWAERVVGEFDGKGKQRDGFTSERRIQRDSLLMGRKLYPTHWDWDDCEEPDRLRNKLHDALNPFGLLLDGASRYRS